MTTVCVGYVDLTDKDGGVGDLIEYLYDEEDCCHWADLVALSVLRRLDKIRAGYLQGRASFLVACSRVEREISYLKSHLLCDFPDPAALLEWAEESDELREQLVDNTLGCSEDYLIFGSLVSVVEDACEADPEGALEEDPIAFMHRAVASCSGGDLYVAAFGGELFIVRSDCVESGENGEPHYALPPSIIQEYTRWVAEPSQRYTQQ